MAEVNPVTHIEKVIAKAGGDSTYSGVDAVTHLEHVIEKYGGGGGGGFTPTQAQLDAMNSGIDSTKVAQIATNTSDISNIQGTIGDINSVLEEVL